MSKFNPRMSMITLGVADLHKAVHFYETGLGFPRHGEGDDVAFFCLNGTWLGLYPREALAEDIGIDIGVGIGKAAAGFSGFTISHNVESEQAVDRTMEHALKVGAELVKKPQKVFWGGYSGYFRDLDGYYWEIAYNPFTWIGPVDDD